jgi:hypothetical protein
MRNYWNTPGVPHKGWHMVDVIDVRADGQPVHETDYESCTMCGNERIRYVHILEHPDFEGQMRTGIVCAEKMTNDYITHHQLERELRNRASRRLNWIKKDWRVSRNGNRTLIVDGNRITIFRDFHSGKYKLYVKNIIGKKLFASLEEAKKAAFDGMEFLKRQGKW